MARTPRKARSERGPQLPGPTSGWRGRRAARAEKRRAEAERQRQEKTAKKALRAFRPSLSEIASYAGSVTRQMLEKPLDLRGVAAPRDLPDKLRTLVAAIESGSLPPRLRLIAVGGLAYFLLITDVIPDLGPMGYADDLVVVNVVVAALAAWHRAGRPDDDE